MSYATRSLGKTWDPKELHRVLTGRTGMLVKFSGLGQAKWVPGQIHFQTTPTGRLPSLQPLIEAGLPIAPYVEHGSYATGVPAIMRYGRDPYRGLGDSPQEIACKDQGGTWTVEGSTAQCILPVPPAIPPVRSSSSLAAMFVIGTGIAAGAAAGLAGGLLKSMLLGTLVGAVGGGAIGFSITKLSLY